MWLGVVAWLSCDCIIHELVDRGSWTGVGGFDSCYRVGL